MVSVESLIKNFNNPNDFNYSIHIDPEFRFIYFNNPKVACSTTKASLNLSYAKSVGKTIEWPTSADIHRRPKNLLLLYSQIGRQKFEEILNSPDVFKFCFLREPLSRLASAYANKVTWVSDNFKALAKRAGKADDWRPSFDEFALTVCGDSELRDCDEHWRLQARQVCLDEVEYHFVGDFGHFGESLAAILGHFFGNSATLFDVRQHFRGNTTDSAALVRRVGPEIRAIVEGAYQRDVDAYEAVAGQVATSALWD